MTRRCTKSVLSLLAVSFVLLLAVIGFATFKNLGWLSPFGIESESRDSQVIRAIERTQEVSLVGLGIQGIKDEQRCREAFGTCLPGSAETVFMQYDFTAKLGIDGADVKVTRTGEGAFRVTVPDFILIGNSEPSFEVAVEDGGVLRWVTPDIDKVEMVNEILNDDAWRTYIEDHRELLEEQTKVFYDGLITSVAPDAATTYEFGS